jgi:hypothetical protein
MLKRGEVMEKMNTSVCCGLERKKASGEVLDGTAQLEGDTSVCFNDAKFCFLLLVTETVGGSQ